MSSRKETKLLMEGWRSFLKEGQEVAMSEAEEQAASPESDSKRVIRVYDFDNTLVEKVGINPKDVLAFVKQNGQAEDGKYNVSTNPDKKSLRTADQILGPDIGYYAMFFATKSKKLPLYADFESHKNSPDTYILTKMTLPEKIELNRDNLIYKWFEENVAGDEKGETDAKTIGDKRRKAIAGKLGISRSQVFIAKKKDAGISAILEKYKPEDVLELLVYDNSEDDIKDIKPTAVRILGADKVKITKV